MGVAAVKISIVPGSYGTGALEMLKWSVLGMGTAEDFEVGSFWVDGLHERLEDILGALGCLCDRTAVGESRDTCV